MEKFKQVMKTIGRVLLAILTLGISEVIKKMCKK